LRSTDTLYSLQKQQPARFSPLSRLAEVKRGLTTNCDDFFIVEDVSAEALRLDDQRAFLANYGVTRARVQAGHARIVRRSDGYQQPLESAHVLPILKTARDIDCFATSQMETGHCAIVLSGNREQLSAFARRYVEAGEREGWHRSPSFENNGGNWYSLRTASATPILFVKTMQYSPVVLWNDAKFVANQRLYTILPSEGVPAAALCAVLNSTLFACERYAAVKALGREAAIDVEVFSANAFRTPTVTQLGDADVELLGSLMTALSGRRLRPMVEESLLNLGLMAARAYVQHYPVSPDTWPEELRDGTRQEIDRIVLELVGVPRAEVSAVRHAMYDELVAYTRRLRLLELEAQLNRQGSADVAGTTPTALADEIWASLIESGAVAPMVIPDDFLELQDEVKEITIPGSGRLRIRTSDLSENRGDAISGTIGRTVIRFANEEERDFVALLAEHGLTGRVNLPTNQDRCRAVLAQVRDYINEVAVHLQHSASELTSDEEMRRRVIREAWKRLHRRA
jgi:hypothetical protein